MRKHYRVKYAGGFGMMIAIWLFSMTGVLIPFAVAMLVDNIEIHEIGGDLEYE